MGFRWLSGEDNIASYASSEKGQRSFCRTCGSVTPALMKNMDLVICPAGNLQGDPGIRPEAHWFVTSKASWYSIADGLPEHEEYPDEFGTTGVTRPAVEATPDALSGSCLCGRIAYRVTGPAVRMMNCHCSRCRRGRSSAHATNLFYRLDDFEFVRGESDVRTYKVPEAQRFAIAFCSNCGGGAPGISRERGFVLVPAGTLDMDPGTRPQAHIFVRSKAPWFAIADDLPQFPEGPPA